MAPTAVNRLAKLDEILGNVPHQYSNKDRLRSDVALLLKFCPTLWPQMGYFVFYLHGVIPISYHGASYNIPVKMSFDPTYPMRPPRCFVTPTGPMALKSGHPNVDAGGMVHAPALSSWNANSSLDELVQVMRNIFSTSPPVCSTARAAARPVQPPRAAVPVDSSLDELAEVMGMIFSTNPPVCATSRAAASPVQPPWAAVPVAKAVPTVTAQPIPQRSRKEGPAEEDQWWSTRVRKPCGTKKGAQGKGATSDPMDPAAANCIANLDEVLRNVPYQYSNRDRLRSDVALLLKSCWTLQPQTGTFDFDVHGVIPISYNGASCNIPVRMSFDPTYPMRPPICFLTPTGPMALKSGHPNVYAGGMVHTPALSSWNANSSLDELVKVMGSIFSADPPVFSTAGAAARTAEPLQAAMQGARVVGTDAAQPLPQRSCKEVPAEDWRPEPPVDDPGRWACRQDFYGRKSCAYFWRRCGRNWASAHGYLNFRQYGKGCEESSRPYSMGVNDKESTGFHPSEGRHHDREAPHHVELCESCRLGHPCNEGA